MKKKKKRVSISTIILVGIMIVGIGVMAYPWISDYINRLHASRAVAGYTEAVSGMDPEEIVRLWKQASDYNKSLLKKQDRFTLTKKEEQEYNDILNINGPGIMAYIEIPKIDVTLPIYHGTDEAVLQIAIGHFMGSTMPVGGPNTHMIITGHRGLPSAKLFTDLDKMEKGDRFYIQTLTIRLTYEVDQITTVLPDQVTSLEIEKDQDYVTMVTCTPYGINTHRLLVRGKRIREPGEIMPDEEGFVEYMKAKEKERAEQAAEQAAADSEQ